MDAIAENTLEVSDKKLQNEERLAQLGRLRELVLEFEEANPEIAGENKSFDNIVAYIAFIVSKEAQLWRLFLEKNQGLVWTIMRKYKYDQVAASQGIDLETLSQEGVKGLARAVLDYDPARGSFGTHAGWWIRDALSYFLKKSRLVASYRHTATLVSLNELVFDDGLTQWQDRLVDDSDGQEVQFLREEAVERVRRALGSLSLDARELEILRRRFGFDDTEEDSLAAIGKDLGISRERIRQLEARVVAKFRAFLDTE